MVALRQQISALEKSSMSYDRKLRELTRAHTQAEKEVAKFDKTARKLREVAKTGDLFKSLLGSLAKFAKYGAIEFGVMTAALGALKLALVAGQAVMKGFRASLTGLGAAAGVAVAAIAAVLGGMRELQVAQMKGTFRSVYQSREMARTSPGLAWESGRSDYSRSAEGSSRLLMGDKRFGMFSDKALQQAMMAQLNAGQRINAQFRNQLASLGDYAAGDEKALVALNEAMAQGAKAGKITEDVYQSLTKASPVMQRAFEELTGGQKQAEAAAKSGSVSFAKFQEVLISGNLDALKPYKGSLDEINNTVFGKVKGALRTLKEELADVALISAQDAYGRGPAQSILDAVKAPIDGIVRSLSGSITAISGSLRMAIPGMLGGLGGAFDKSMERFVFYTVKGMSALDGLSAKFNVWIGKIREFFGIIGDYIRSVTGPFDRLMETFLKPLFSFLVGVLNTALQSFGSALDSNGDQIAQWGRALEGVGKFMQLFFDALNVVKTVVTPVVTVFLEFLSVIGEIYEALDRFGVVLKGLMAFALLRVGFLRGLIGVWQKWKMALHQTLTAFQQGASQVQYFRMAVDDLTAAINRLNAAQGQSAAMGATMLPGGGISPTTISNRLTRQQTTLAPVTAQQVQNRLARVGTNPQPLPAGLGGQQVAPGRFAGFRGAMRTRWQGWNSKFSGRGPSWQNASNGPGLFSNTSRYYKSAAFKAMSPQAQQAAREAQAARSAKAANAAIGLTVAGGLMQQSSNDAVSIAGSGASMAGMGGMIAPMLGMSGPAGMAIGAGLGIGGAIASKTPKTSVAGQATGRAIQGAAVGGAIGSFAGPVGTAIGVAAGGIIGGIVGGVMAKREQERLKDKSEKDARRKFTKEAINSRAEYKARVEGNVRERMRLKSAIALQNEQKTLETKLRTGNYYAIEEEGIRERLANVKKESKQYADLRKQYYSLERASKGNAESARKLQDQGMILEQNFKAGNFFGFKPKQLAAYADRHGMDLSKVNLSITALIKLSGYSGDAADAMANLALSAKRLYEDLSAPLKAEKERLETSVAAQTAYAEYGRTMVGGGFGSEEQNKIGAIDVVDKMLAAQTGALAAGQFGGATGFQDYVNAAAGQFAGLGSQIEAQGGNADFLNNAVATALSPIANKVGGKWFAKTDMATQMQYNPQVAQFMATQKDAFRNRMNALTPEEQAGKKGRKLRDEFATTTEGGLRMLGVTPTYTKEGPRGPVTNDLTQQVKNAFTGEMEAQGVGTKAKIKAAFEEGSAQTKRRIEKGFDEATQKFKGKFKFKVNGQDTEVTVGDTTTARYGRTMAAHAMLNRQIPGNRTITSGIRNWGLGSINSDHLTGAAYDLTGQNLGSYAQLVKNSGGFAEFHGGSLRRHLHVVPGPGPLGDTASVRAPMLAGAGGGTAVSHNYSIVVNAPEGTSPEAIADAVIARVRREQRDMMERS